jgi:hypothetical protein
MKKTLCAFAALIAATPVNNPALAHTLHAKGEAALVAQNSFTVTPTQDWNELSMRIGKNAELWTVDGELLDEVTFIGAVTPGQALVRERSRKRDPLPKFESTTLTAELPELWERTIRASKSVKTFTIKSTEPVEFLKTQGVRFTFEYADEDALVRNGEAYAALVGGKLYLISYEAPRLGYFAKHLNEFHHIVESARIG